MQRYEGDGVAMMDNVQLTWIGVLLEYVGIGVAIGLVLVWFIHGFVRSLVKFVKGED